MQRIWKSDPAALLLLIAPVVALFCGVAAAQEEQIPSRPTSDRDSMKAQVAATNREIKPSDVFAHVALLRDEIELIRSQMDKPKTTRSEIEVANVAPREVFFQAQTLFRRADDLCFEITRNRGVPPTVPEGEIRPTNVWSVVEAALDRIRLVKTRLAITKQTHENATRAEHTPTDVFRSIVQAGRQLDLLLSSGSTCGDLFQQVTVGVSYGARLLSRFPGAERIPAARPLDPDADLQDVHLRLLKCFERLRAIGAHCGLEAMSLSPGSPNFPDTGPLTVSESYDVATMIVSELAYIHAMLKDIRPPQQVYYPGDKRPAQVFERAGILALQLEHLQRLVRERPNAFRMSDNGLVRANGGGRKGGWR